MPAYEEGYLFSLAFSSSSIYMNPHPFLSISCRNNETSLRAVLDSFRKIQLDDSTCRKLPKKNRTTNDDLQSRGSFIFFQEKLVPSSY